MKLSFGKCPADAGLLSGPRRATVAFVWASNPHGLRAAQKFFIFEISGIDPKKMGSPLYQPVEHQSLWSRK
jgi:hypothetical protein